jgi:hypothetical protein
MLLPHEAAVSNIGNLKILGSVVKKIKVFMWLVSGYMFARISNKSMAMIVPGELLTFLGQTLNPAASAPRRGGGSP